MKLSTFTGASLVYAVAIRSAAAQTYKYCIGPLEGGCPIWGIEAACPVSALYGPQDCFDGLDCLACHFDENQGMTAESNLINWCYMRHQGKIATEQELKTWPAHCQRY